MGISNAHAYPELAQGKNASASSFTPGSPASNAVDGVMVTPWIAGGAGAIYPSYWMVDLGANDSINIVRLAYLSGYNYSLNITVSNDNITFTQIYANSSYYNGADLIFLPNITVPSTNARYIKIWLISNPADPTIYPELQEVQIYGTPTPILYTPLNQSTQTKAYPPITTYVNFTWDVQNANLLVAKDSNFNLIAVDTTISNNYSIQSLEARDYWWKVRYYNSTSGTYGNYSDTFNFTLTNNVSATGTGIQGVVYENVAGVSTPVSNARVIIRNDVLNWTSEMITGSNGYYLFSNLTNSTTYTIYATKSDTFKDSVAYYVTTGLGTISTQNILLERCYSGFDCFYNQAYVTFSVQNLFGVPYSGVAVSVYEGDGIVAVKTGTTGTDGTVTFLLKKDQEYRLIFIKASNSINQEIIITPGESKDFTILIWSFGENRDDSVSWNLSANDHNATTTYLNLTYNDTSGLTTLINFWVLNGSNISQTIYSSSSASASYSVGYAVNNTVAGSFVYGFNATRNGVIMTENKAITFAGSSGTLIDLKIDSKYYPWISVMFLVSLSLLFSYKSNRNGYILIPLIALLLSFVGWFTISYLITSSALVIGVIAYLRSAEKKSEVGY